MTGMSLSRPPSESLADVVIVDYGLGNLRSATRGLERAGANVTITDDPDDFAAADGIVLPGVGAFREGMENAGPYREALADAVSRGQPVFGICLGMQTDQYAPRLPAEAGVDDRAGLLGDRHCPVQQTLARHLPQRDDQVGVDAFDFAVQKIRTVRQFLGVRVAVLRRPTPDAVGDANVRAGEAGVPEGVVQHRPRPTHEGFAVLVFLGSGCLADEQEGGVVGAGAVDDATPGLDERRTAFAGAHVRPVGFDHDESVGTGGS